jgi:hypothetical protein
MCEKPKCKLIGEDGNIYNLLGVARRILHKNNLQKQAIEMQERAFKAKSYEDALCIIMDYVDVE